MIAFNQGPGVVVSGDNTVGHQMRGNSIFSNGGLEIDLGDDGVTLSDSGDADVGPNQLANFADLDLVETGANTRLAGSYIGAANATLTIDFYASSELDPSGYGGGERYLGTTEITTDAQGDAIFDATLVAATTDDEWITSTATDAAALRRGIAPAWVWDGLAGMWRTL